MDSGRVERTWRRSGQDKGEGELIYLSLELLTRRMHTLSLYPLGVLEETVARPSRCLDHCVYAMSRPGTE